MKSSRQAAFGIGLLIGAAIMPIILTPAQNPEPDSATIHPSSLRAVARIDERFQSYNVEMAEIIGGNFWKPYGPGGTVAASSTTPLAQVVAGMDPNLFQEMPPLNTANARLRRLAAALGPAYVRVSGTWANSVYFHDSDSPPPAKPPEGFNGILTRAQWKGVIDFAHAANAELVSSFTISAGVRDRSGVWTPVQARKWLAYTKAVRRCPCWPEASLLTHAIQNENLSRPSLSPAALRIRVRFLFLDHSEIAPMWVLGAAPDFRNQSPINQ